MTHNLVFVGADVETGSGADGGVHAFDRFTGQQRWKYAAERGVMAKIIGREPRLFVSTIKREFLCLDMTSGKRLWNCPLQWSPWESAATAGNRIFLGSNDGTLCALDVQSGRIEWRTNLAAAVSTSICSAGKRLYVGTADGVVHRINMRKGEVLSSLKPDMNLMPASLPVTSGDALLVLLVDKGADYRALVSLDLALSRIRWYRRAPDRWTTTRIFATRNIVVLGTKSGGITSYSTVDGEPKWSLDLPGTIRAVGGSEDVLYVGTIEGRLYAVRTPKRSLALGS